MTKSSVLLKALIAQFPEMGEFHISEEEDVKDVIWSWFHVRLKCDIKIPKGHIIYRFILEDDDYFPMKEFDAKLTNKEGDVIYLYFMDE